MTSFCVTQPRRRSTAEQEDLGCCVVQQVQSILTQHAKGSMLEQCRLVTAGAVGHGNRPFWKCIVTSGAKAFQDQEKGVHALLQYVQKGRPLVYEHAYPLCLCGLSLAEHKGVPALSCKV